MTPEQEIESHLRRVEELKGMIGWLDLNLRVLECNKTERAVFLFQKIKELKQNIENEKEFLLKEIERIRCFKLFQCKNKQPTNSIATSSKGRPRSGSQGHVGGAGMQGLNGNRINTANRRCSGKKGYHG